MPRDLVMKLLDQKVDQYMQQSHHCAQSSFMALKEIFGLKGDQVVKALTPLPGIAERGETCGAVTGPLMAMGLIYGRGIHQLDNWDTYQESLVPTGEFCADFEEEFGTTLCLEVQQGKFGRCFRLNDPEELQEFQNAGATEKCSEVVRKAVQLAAGIILDDPELG
jgi:C_GCAxxG_C_C family probable redox protein